MVVWRLKMPLFDFLKFRKSEVTVYTTPGCPDCAAVKRYLDSRDIAYREKDVTRNEAWLDEMVTFAGVRVAPVTRVGKHAFYGTFASQRPKLDEVLGLSSAEPGTAEAGAESGG